jgi:hypothetical protein
VRPRQGLDRLNQTSSGEVRGGMGVEEAATNWVYFRNRALVCAAQGDENGLAKAQESFRLSALIINQFSNQEEVGRVIEQIEARQPDLGKNCGWLR